MDLLASYDDENTGENSMSASPKVPQASGQISDKLENEWLSFEQMIAPGGSEPVKQSDFLVDGVVAYPGMKSVHTTSQSSMADVEQSSASESDSEKDNVPQLTVNNVPAEDDDDAFFRLRKQVKERDRSNSSERSASSRSSSGSSSRSGSPGKGSPSPPHLSPVTSVKSHTSEPPDLTESEPQAEVPDSVADGKEDSKRKSQSTKSRDRSRERKRSHRSKHHSSSKSKRRHSRSRDRRRRSKDRHRRRDRKASKDESRRSKSRERKDSTRSDTKDDAKNKSNSKDDSYGKRSRSRDRKDRKKDKRRSRSRHRSKERRRSRSRDRKRSRSKDRKRSKSRERKRSRSKDRRRSKSRERKRSRSKDRKRSRSKDRKRHRSRSRERRSRSRHRSRDRHSRSRSHERLRSRSPVLGRKLTFKEQMRKDFINASKEMAKDKVGTEEVTLPVRRPGEALKPSDLLKGVTLSSGESVTPQMALMQTMAVMHKKAQELTGVEVPKYYNPAAVNPLKYAEQVQKRKLLWSKKTEQKDKNEQIETQWKSAFIAEDDGKTASKFRKLMGMKEAPSASSESVSEDIQKMSEEQRRKQQELFQRLDQEYQFARMTTHTQRGVGLGFSTTVIDPNHPNNPP